MTTDLAEDRAEAITEYIFEALGHNITLEEETTKQLTINIPTSHQAKFKEFFDRFDTCLDELGVKSYSIQMTTLTSVFENIGSLNRTTMFEGNESDRVR